MHNFCELLETGHGPDYDEDVKKVEDELTRVHHIFHRQMEESARSAEPTRKMKKEKQIGEYHKKVKQLKAERDRLKQIKSALKRDHRKIASCEKKGETNTQYHQSVDRLEEELLKLRLERQETERKQEDEDME